METNPLTSLSANQYTVIAKDAHGCQSNTVSASIFDPPGFYLLKTTI